MAFQNNSTFRINGRNNQARNPDSVNYSSSLMSRFNRDYERRRRQDHTTSSDADHEVLTVVQTEFYASENARSHNTEEFELVRSEPRTPVLRRGQSFYMAMKFDDDFRVTRDIVRLAFVFGPKPSVTKGTRALIELKKKDQLDEEKWDARICGETGNIVSVQVNIPVTTPVGLWNLNIHTGSVSTTSFKRYKCKEDIYILFNPWVPGDGVYLEDESERKEYVLNDTGKIWMGSHLKPKGRRWFYGQFDDVVLPVAVHLLEKSGLKHGERGNPVQMARAISAVINSEDDDGLIVGKWEGSFDDGVSPFAWTGSVGIMERYLKSNGKSVKYGQCWVFSGAAVTICRALGIPARPVTNYASAHDTNGSLTLDKYFTRDGTEIEGGPDGDCYDSCWNFHVWVDVWMKRPDLPREYSGWQVIDSTPQELSDNAYRCGPVSIEAIRRGEVGYLYDTPFAFAAVNADIIHFQEDENSSWGFSRLNFDDCHVGKKLVTKKVGVDEDDENSGKDMEDVTSLYKNPEGSDSERMAVFKAIKGIAKARQQYEVAHPSEEDVKFRLKEIDSVPFGEPFDVVVHMENTSDKPRTVQATMTANSVFYTGVTAHTLKKAAGKIVLKPRQTEVMHISIAPEAYLDKLVEHNLIKFYAIVNVRETRQTWSKEDDFPLTKPSIDVLVSGELKTGSTCTVHFSFVNPVDRRLTGCTITIEGPGLQRPKLTDFRDVEPRERVTHTETFVPKRTGERKIMASFNSNILTGITGSKTVTIQEGSA